MPLEGLRSRLEAGLPWADALGYGPLRPVADATTGLPLLELPQGFRYLSFGWTGDPMSDGRRTPPRHDGMAAFPGRDGQVVLVRNHEVSAAPAFGDAPYDPRAGGGTTTLVFDPEAERMVTAMPSLSGTYFNCAGGPTPWGTWLSCEETVLGPWPDNPLTRQHGYIFEVPADGVSSATPIEAMGCFTHEAIAVDPETGIVYETQDRAVAGLYRFVPATPGRLADGGRLQMLAVDGRPRLDTSRGQRQGVAYGVHWVDIPEPNRPHTNAAALDAHGVVVQGLARGGAVFSRLEGAWFDAGRLYVTATDGGDARAGQVWELDPRAERLRLLFQSPGYAVLNMPDNICMSPRGGLVICENGELGTGLAARLHGLTRDGRLFAFARNSVRLAGQRNAFEGDFAECEFAGATYSPDGRWLFVNIQIPGITFAITGPWAEGGL